MRFDEIVDKGLARQVFDGGLIRSPAQQEVWINRQERRSRPETSRPEKHGRFVLDDVIRTVRLGNHAIPFAELDDLHRECKRRGWHRS